MANVDDTPGDVDADLPDDTWTVAEVNEEIAAVLEAASDRFPAYVVGEPSTAGRLWVRPVSAPEV